MPHFIAALTGGSFFLLAFIVAINSTRVNRYRVEESKRLLTTPQYQHLSMVGIAFEAGFNSKTAFNTAFKKITDVSPTEFQKLNNR